MGLSLDLFEGGRHFSPGLVWFHSDRNLLLYPAIHVHEDAGRHDKALAVVEIALGNRAAECKNIIPDLYG